MASTALTIHITIITALMLMISGMLPICAYCVTPSLASGKAPGSQPLSALCDWDILLQRTLAFLYHVAHIDLNSYRMSRPSYYIDTETYVGHVLQGVYLHLRAYDNTTSIDVRVEFVDGVFMYYDADLWSAGRYWPAGIQPADEPRPKLTRDFDGPLDAAKAIIRSYINFTDAPYCSRFLSVLEGIDEIGNATIQSEGLVLRMKVHGEPWNDVRFSFARVVELPNGVKRNVFLKSLYLRVDIDDGFLSVFGDDWRFYKIGSTEVNISEEEALQMTVEAAMNFAEKDGANVTIAKYWINITMDTPDPYIDMHLGGHDALRDDVFKLYPVWQVVVWYSDVFWSETYGGYVESYRMDIWADTGEVRFKKPEAPSGVYGDLPRKPYGPHKPQEDTTPGGGQEASPPVAEDAPLLSYWPLIALAISSSLAAYSIRRARRLIRRSGRKHDIR